MMVTVAISSIGSTITFASPEVSSKVRVSLFSTMLSSTGLTIKQSLRLLGVRV